MAVELVVRVRVMPADAVAPHDQARNRTRGHEDSTSLGTRPGNSTRPAFGIDISPPKGRASTATRSLHLISASTVVYVPGNHCGSWSATLSSRSLTERDVVVYNATIPMHAEQRLCLSRPSISPFVQRRTALSCKSQLSRVANKHRIPLTLPACRASVRLPRFGSSRPGLPCTWVEARNNVWRRISMRPCSAACSQVILWARIVWFWHSSTPTTAYCCWSHFSSTEMPEEEDKKRHWLNREMQVGEYT
jgi:hypothetical protein